MRFTIFSVALLSTASRALADEASNHTIQEMLMSLWGGGASGGAPMAGRFLEAQDSVPRFDGYEPHQSHAAHPAVHYDHHPAHGDEHPLHLYDEFGRQYTLMPDFDGHDDYHSLGHGHDMYSHYHPFDAHHESHDVDHHPHEFAHGFDPLDHLEVFEQTQSHHGASPHHEPMLEHRPVSPHHTEGHHASPHHADMHEVAHMAHDHVAPHHTPLIE